MNESKISVRYARALFQSALKKNILDEGKSGYDFYFRTMQASLKQKNF
jgi:F0F1-type ATP synthase delta subunit